MKIRKGNVVNNWNISYNSHHTTYSENYDTPSNLSNNIQHELVKEDIEQYLAYPYQANILECGCGGARTSLYLARRGFNVTCSDFAPEAIRLAIDNFAHYNATGKFIQDDLLNSKIQAESFDCVMSFGLLEHFDDLSTIVRSITKLVKPGGIQIHMIIPKKFSTETIMNALLYPFRIAKNICNRNFENIFVKSFRDFPHFENSYSATDYRKVFAKEGNTILRCEARGVLYPFIALPVGVGEFIVKSCPNLIANILRNTSRSESKIIHFLSLGMCVICRKK